MRTTVCTLLLLAISATSVASVKLQPACNQELYDSLYKQIILETIKDENYTLRNLRIQMLRKLCNGQKSTYEREYPNAERTQPFINSKALRIHTRRTVGKS